MSNVTVVAPTSRTETLEEYLSRHQYNTGIYVSSEEIREFGQSQPAGILHTVELDDATHLEAIKELCEKYTRIIPGSVTIKMEPQVVLVD